MVADRNKTQQEWKAIIERSRPFIGLSAGVMDQLWQQGTIRTLADGYILVHEGDRLQNLYVVLSGNVITQISTDDGDAVTIQMLAPTDNFGASSIFTNTLSPLSARTYGPTCLWLLPAITVKQLVLSNANFAENMLFIAGEDYHSSLLQIGALALKTPLQRIGHYLLCEHIAHGSQDLSFPLPHKKAVIANHLGMTPETLSRCFAKIRTLGIDIQDHNVQLKNSFALCHFCDLHTREICECVGKQGCPLCIT